MSACSFGICAVATCEKCKPKLVVCPTCGKKTYLCNKCMFCSAEIPQEVQQAAVDTWRAKHQKELN